MVTKAQTFKAGERPRVRVRNALGGLETGFVLCRINSRTAYVRNRHIVGELAYKADRVEIIRHADGTPVLEMDQWPPLTPYDTGERAQPMVWTTPDRRRPEEHDPDRYGKVDFEDDSGTTLATVHVERVDGCYVLVAYSHSTDSIVRVNLDADLGVIQDRIVRSD